MLPASPARNSAAWSGSADWRSPTTQPSRDSVPYCRVGTTRSGAVEGAGHDLDPRTVDAAKAQRRAAIPCRNRARRSRRSGTRPACPGSRLKSRVLDVGEGSERRAGRLLAHPAMADADLAPAPPTAQSGWRRIGSRRSERVLVVDVMLLHQPIGFLQRRQRVAAGEDKIVNARRRGAQLPARRAALPDRYALRRRPEGPLRRQPRARRRPCLDEHRHSQRRARSLERCGERRRIGKSSRIDCLDPAGLEEALSQTCARAVKSAGVPRLARKIFGRAPALFRMCIRLGRAAPRTARPAASAAARRI